MKAVVAGATGLIGGYLITELENDSAFNAVVALTRKPKQNSAKTTWKVVDFDLESKLESATEGADVVFCCLGTTMKKAGSKEAFYKVDFQYVVDLAKAAKKNGIRQFSVISAMGADAKSKVFYNQVKGEMEAAIRELGFNELIIFHPSLLLGPREESRFGERVGIVLGKIFSPLLFGSLKKYHPIHVSHIAEAMSAEAKTEADRIRVLEYDAILEMSK
ncbi:oxidoreductase [Cryomorpha ignava]|uniref:Oxidoreductase n=1 Tax=Cryomorpha ignava TaxID=101383 RepID=A0A7K3WSA6_9FLAO|nr:oxidoreductase [Cryomorpha ignava]NEN24569.1 oxidoreductase [Cryomorpha ignava]